MSCMHKFSHCLVWGLKKKNQSLTNTALMNVTTVHRNSNILTNIKYLITVCPQAYILFSQNMSDRHVLSSGVKFLSGDLFADYFYMSPLIFCPIVL